MSFSFSRLKDPGYFAENRTAAHSDHVAFGSRQELEAGRTGFRCSLNGLWKFYHALNEDQVIPGFEGEDYDCRPWADIPVPAHIQMEGYGVPQYCNVQYPWDGREQLSPGETPEKYNPVACYVKYFMLPEQMKGHRVFISFQGAESCLAVWLNGQYVGFSSDSFTPDEFELTPYLKEGENKLACRVYRWNAGSWLEDQDFMRFSGLFRDVYIYCIPDVHIRDLRIRTLLDDACRDAALQVVLQMEAEEEWQVRLALKEKGRKVAEALASGTGSGEARVDMEVKNPRKWSAEDPFLYDLEMEVLDEGGEMTEIVPQRVGFRRFEIRNSLMLLNGKRIVFKGTNRHDYCAETGRAVTPEKIRRDLITMKRNNINAVRTSHYPNHSALYSLCDELGLYLIAETNMETHGTWDEIMSGKWPVDHALPGNKTEWQGMLLDRVNSAFQRDKNHPAVLIWSCGNESFGGSVIHEMAMLFHRLDDTRPVHYEGVSFGRDFGYPDTTDMYSEMYTPVAKIREFQKTHRDKPFILCEYTHSMGNSNGAMHWYTEYAYEEELFQGGFIWDFLDQTIHTRDRRGQVTLTYGGDQGDRPHDGNFSGNGIVYGDGRETPKMQEVKYNYQNILARVEEKGLKVINRSLFTDTSAFECVVKLERDGREIAREILETKVPPLNEGVYDLPFGEQRVPGEYALTASFRLREDQPWAEKGYEVAFGQSVWTVEGEKPALPHAPLRIIRGDKNLGVRGDSFEVMFSYQSGGLSSYRWGGREMLRVYPRPNFWRAPIDNDLGNGMPLRYAQWKLASLYQAPARPGDGRRTGAESVRENPDGSVSIDFVYDLPTAPKASCGVSYTVFPCGRVKVRMDYDPVEGLGDMPEFGMIMKMDGDYDTLKWYGLGPEENYRDRREGARLGIWQKGVRENMARYPRPQESGSHTGVRWAEVTDFRGRGLRFSGKDMEFSALPWTPHEIENAQHDFELPPVNYTVVRAGMQQMGVGGDDSWGSRTHEEYLIDVSKPLRFEFCFEGIL